MVKRTYRESLQRYAQRRLEFLLVAAVIITACTVVALVPHKLIAMNVLFLPTVLAAYALGARSGGLTALFSFLVIAIYAILNPNQFVLEVSPILLGLDLAVWGAFLGLTGLAVGSLCDRNRQQTREIRAAYIGVLEILTKFLETSDRDTECHSVRVSELSVAIAEEMGLSEDETEDVRVGALLHDIGKTDSMELVKRASTLDQSEKRRVAGHTDTGAALIRSVGSILQEAVPIILYHHHYFDGTGKPGPVGIEIPLGARIVAVADAYDAIVSDRPYRKGRTPSQALAEIDACAGTQFDPDVVEAFKQIQSFDGAQSEVQKECYELVGVEAAASHNDQARRDTFEAAASLQTLDDLSLALDNETQD